MNTFLKNRLLNMNHMMFIMKMQVRQKLFTVHRVIGKCNPENTPSSRLLERLLMIREGHFRKPAYFKKTIDGKAIWHDAYQYSILEEDWFNSTK
ncbi:GNAT family N-acetyltransferase [Clostridium gasigenes]|uniref:GNAT family N-acetyltransferase n=1 Tax=Clostridium gasigenes TaxID=94869 RepID=UPI001FABED73|nr:GNAT family protein [Clostridium gasigenes]